MRRRIWERTHYTPHAAQQRVHSAIDRGAKRVAPVGGRRGGKSECCATEAATELSFKPVGHLPKRLVLIAGPEADTTDHIFRLLWKWIVDENIYDIGAPKAHLKKSERERYIETPWRSRVEGKTTKDPTSLRGSGLVMTIADEYAFGGDVLDEYLTKPLMDCNGILMLPTTPNGRNHFYSTYKDWEALSQTDPFYYATRWTSYDNPFLPAGAVAREEEEARRKGKYDLFRQECLTEFTALSGAVYPLFSEERHTGEPEPIRDLPIDLGIDWGFTNPFSCTFHQWTPDDRFIALDEVYLTGLTPEEQSVKVNERLQRFEAQGLRRGTGYADPASPGAIKTFRTAGMTMWEPSDSGFRGRYNNVLEGIGYVRELINRGLNEDGTLIEGMQPGLMVHKRCTNVIKSLMGYQFPEVKDGKEPKENPVKKDDHGADSVRYPITAHLGGGIRPGLWSFA